MMGTIFGFNMRLRWRFLDDLNQFRAGKKFEDDVTLVVFKRK
jgi:serine phosphatase RsbU (regulator of sigma subunit)